MALKASTVLALLVLSACGGGGGSQPAVYESSDVIRYPYETVFGDVCRSGAGGGSEPTPGCTFVRTTGRRVTVSADPNYNQQGFGSDDMWYVQFNSFGTASVYDDLGVFQYFADPSDFAGHISGNTIGVGNTGAFWENVSGNQYWFGKNGVLYSANTGASNYGQAINNKDANKSGDSDSFALKSAANVKLIKAGAAKLTKSYGIPSSKAVAIASALNSWGVMAAERGKVTEQDMDKTFRTLSGGASFKEALAAFKGYQAGDSSIARELTNRSAANLGITPDETERYMKALYGAALSSTGHKADDIKW